MHVSRNAYNTASAAKPCASTLRGLFRVDQVHQQRGHTASDPRDHQQERAIQRLRPVADVRQEKRQRGEHPARATRGHQIRPTRGQHGHPLQRAVDVRKLKAMQAKRLPVDAEVLKVLRLTGRTTSTDLGTIGWTCARVRHRLTQESISLLNQWLRAILAKIFRIPANSPFSAPARSPHLAQVPSGQTVQLRRPS